MLSAAILYFMDVGRASNSVRRAELVDGKVYMGILSTTDRRSLTARGRNSHRRAGAALVDPVLAIRSFSPLPWRRHCRRAREQSRELIPSGSISTPATQA